MKRILSGILSALVALSFSAVVFAADATPPTEAAAPAVAEKNVVKKPAKKVRKARKANIAKKAEMKKEEAPAVPAAK